MGVNHRGAHIPVPKQFLNRPDVIAVFQQMRGEGMTESMAACGFRDASLQDRLLYRALQNGFVEVVPALLSCAPVGIMACRWKDPLPRPRFACIRVFALKSIGQGNTTKPFLEIFIVLRKLSTIVRHPLVAFTVAPWRSAAPRWPVDRRAQLDCWSRRVVRRRCSCSGRPEGHGSG